LAAGPSLLTTIYDVPATRSPHRNYISAAEEIQASSEAISWGKLYVRALADKAEVQRRVAFTEKQYKYFEKKAIKKRIALVHKMKLEEEEKAIHDGNDDNSAKSVGKEKERAVDEGGDEIFRMEEDKDELCDEP
jgi:hypothetical protein